MPLFRRRKAQTDKAERRSRGESVPLTTEFDREARTGILFAIMDNAPSHLGGYLNSPGPPFMALIHGIVCREWKQLRLRDRPDPADDLYQFILSDSDGEKMLDVIEAFFVASQDAESRLEMPSWGDREQIEKFRLRVNEVLDDHDIAYQVVGNEIVPRESMAMYGNVVAPALSLLHGNPRFEKVESAFRDALRELKPGGSPADAITDAGTALQEMLVAQGAEGKSLGPLLTSARKRELLGPYDSKLAEGMELIGEWVSADRSTRGDTHSVTDADVDDAWLAVHVVGALLLRLEKRGKS